MRKKKEVGRWEFRVFSRVTLNDEPADSRGELWGTDPFGKLVPVPGYGHLGPVLFSPSETTVRHFALAVTHGIGQEEYLQLASAWWDHRLGVVPVDKNNAADVAACEEVGWINDRRLAWLKSVGAKQEVTQ